MLDYAQHAKSCTSQKQGGGNIYRPLTSWTSTISTPLLRMLLSIEQGVKLGRDVSCASHANAWFSEGEQSPNTSHDVSLTALQWSIAYQNN